MQTLALAGHAPAAIDLNQPGSYLNWNVFTISVANLVLIAVMVVIFGAALLLPFPGRHRPNLPPEAARPNQTRSPATRRPRVTRRCGRRGRAAGRWARSRRTSCCPIASPPTSPPGCTCSASRRWPRSAWSSRAGFAIALGGTDWWHTNPVGHFFNSLHLWSVELFMALLVIHLWGKFWMAAWRGRRAVTWITGVVAFIASIVVCFTGYLSQQNFDSQWIATNGKDAFNAAGIGAFFNLMNFGQMLLWHVVLLPILLIAMIGAHVLLVRMRGVSHPLPAARPRGRAARRAARKADRAAWRGPTRRYDILKEGTLAVVVILALTFGLAGLLSSPNVPPITIPSWAQVAPADFLATAASELNGTSLTATYGPPYNTNGTPQAHVVRPGELGRRAAAHRRGAGPSCLAADPDRPHYPALAAPWPPTRPRPPACRTSGRPTTSTPPPRSSSPAGCRCSRRATTARSRPCSPPSWPWPGAARSTPT